MLTTGSPHSCTFVGPFVGRRFVTTFAPVAVTCFVTGSVDGQFIEGFDRELMPNLAMQVNYTYGRVTNLPTAVNNTSEGPWPDHCRLGGTDPLVGTTPDGVSYNLPLFIPDTAKVAATGGGRHLTNYDGYATMFGGIELAMTKRMSDGSAALYLWAQSWSQALPVACWSPAPPCGNSC